MNKKVMKAAFVAAIAMVSGINVFNTQKSEVLSDIALANVEALADYEDSGTEQIKCYSSLVYEKGASVVDCSTCQSVEDKTDKFWSLSGKCTRYI